jgi:hypothetical protein
MKWALGPESKIFLLDLDIKSLTFSSFKMSKESNRDISSANSGTNEWLVSRAEESN